MRPEEIKVGDRVKFWGPRNAGPYQGTVWKLFGNALEVVPDNTSHFVSRTNPTIWAVWFHEVIECSPLEDLFQKTVPVGTENA